MMLSFQKKFMKSNFLKKDILLGQEIIKKISESNVKLLPEKLKEIISEYKNFIPLHQKTNFLHHPKKTKHKLSKKYDKVILLLSGLTASGKDAIFQKINERSPDLFSKTVTATSRLPRENEIHGHDYYFFESNQIFIKSVKNGEFIEFYKRGETYYGLPKESVKNSLNNPTPIIYSQIEMSGWSKLEKYIKTVNQNIAVLRMFILPDMDFSDYKNWLSQKRNDHDLQSRIDKTGWELKKAPKKSDFLIINNFKEGNNSLEEISQNIIDQIKNLLK